MATNVLPFARAVGAKAGDPYAHRYVIAITVTLASILELLDTSIVNVAIPHIMASLGATLDQITWVSTGYIVANVIILPLTGWLAARFGRRRYFAASILIFTAASFGCGNAHTLGALVAMRILQGLGGGALLSTSQAILYEVFPPEEYGAAMAIFGMGIMVGPTLGPTLGGTITDALSWPWIFYINVPIGLLAFALSLAFIHDSRHVWKIGKVDWLGIALLVLGIGALQTLLERGERADWFSSREIVAYAVVSGLALVTLVWHELTTEHPVVDLRILGNRQFGVGVLFATVLGLCLYATVFVLPVYLQSLQGFSAHQTGMVILPGALASAFTMAVMARLSGKFDPRLWVFTGVSLFLASMVLHGRFTTESGMDDYFWPLILRGTGLGMIFVPMTNLALAQLDMRQIPGATGLYNLFRQLGGSIGIALSATLVTRFTAQTRAVLAEDVTRYSEPGRERLAAIIAKLTATGTPPPLAEGKAIAMLNGIVTRQAMMISFEHLFLLFGFSFLLALPLLLLMKPGAAVRAAGDAH